ncbi:MAG: formyltransferase family protein [Angustibacter sp.]
MRFGFITCVRLGESCLEELAGLGANLVYLGTLHDDMARGKSGRIYLDDFANAHDVPLHKFRNMNDPDAVESVRAAELDWLYVVGWSQLAKREILQTPSRGVIGIHPTMLPQGRGRASIPWAIIKGLEQTGVTMFKLDEGMDTGPILGQIPIPVSAGETSTTLYEKVVAAHRALIRQTYVGLAEGTIEAVPQDESQASIWPGRRPGDGELDLGALTPEEVDRHVRALTHPYPGAFVRLGDDRVLRIWKGQPGRATGKVLRTSSGPYTATEFSEEIDRERGARGTA